MINELHRRHNQALQRIADIKSEIKNLENEKKELETESYIKARVLSEPLTRRDPETLKEYGQRLKSIQRRTREIETTIDRLLEERNRISKPTNET